MPSLFSNHALHERVGETLGGRWALDALIGTGSMGAVYSAHDAEGRRVAVKIIHPELAARSDVRPRFEREAELGTKLRHPTVVQVFDQDMHHPKGAYLVMELLEGETLGDRIDRDALPARAELLGIVEQVLGGLETAHAAQVVHRDLKPDNIFLTRGGQVKLIDFGIARKLSLHGEDDLTRIGVAIGTVAYMAPEQARGARAEIDARSDLYAVGAILFRLLTGRSPHQADTPAAQLAQVATRAAPPIATVEPGIDPHLAAVIDVALAFSREARYPDARTMRLDLAEVRQGRPPPHAWSIRHAREELPTLMHESELEARAGSAPAGGQTALSSKPPHFEPGDERALVGSVLADRYRILELLGVGGMGAVYRAEHVHMRKSVAVKVLHREMTERPEAVARFEREAVAAARIDHPNVVAAKDFGRLPDGSFYLVLELIEGESLRRMLGREGPLPAARVAQIGAQIAEALAAAHAVNIIHRDLKPDNVMLVGGRSERVKVLDFGIAKVGGGGAEQALTRIGSVFGTPEYMSPEQAVGQGVDGRTDLYSLGILLYEMLAGKQPFAGSDHSSVLTLQMTRPPPPLPASVDPALAAIVTRLLQKSPADRVQSASEVAALLAPLAAPSPGAAASPSSAEGPSSTHGPSSAEGSGPNASPASLATPPLAPTLLDPSLPTARAGQPLPGAARVATTLPDVGRWVSGAVGRQLGGLRPAVVIGGGALLLAVVIVAGAVALGGESVTDRAGAGDPEAMAELMAVEVQRRSASEWLALARGFARIGQREECRTTLREAAERGAQLDVSPSELCATARRTPPR